MWSERHRLGKPPGRVNIVTFSGPHGVGKSTIIKDMQISEVAYRPKFFLVPSVSTYWFQGYKSYAAESGLPVPETYEDINRFGIREMMQREMPRVLTLLVIDAVNNATRNGNGIVLVDRWFGDIAAYTALELSPEKTEELWVESVKTYKGLMELLIEKANDYRGSLSLTHIFVPASSCQHEMPRGKTAEKAMRGTQPAEEWEAAYARFNAFTEDYRTLELTTPDRLLRVAEVFRGISD